MKKTLTQKQVNKKYFGKYISFSKTYCYATQQWLYEVKKTFKEINENTTLGQDVGTSFEFSR